MAEEYTLSYSEGVKGWPSFYSYTPEWILAMNQYMYTFKGGNLWRHNTGSIRNNYYDVQGFSTITGVFNQDPTTTKLFKTIEMEGDSAWECDLESNLGKGKMVAADFELKEGTYFSYIRRRSGDYNTSLRSTQGIGSIIGTTGSSPGTITLTFNFSIGSMLSLGDNAYFPGVDGFVEIGKIISISEDRKEISVDAVNLDPSGTSVTPGSFIFYTKDSVAESYGTLGYYLQFDLKNTSTNAVELFNIDTEAFKSAP
jgi:hypothetical protein